MNSDIEIGAYDPWTRKLEPHEVTHTEEGITITLPYDEDMARIHVEVVRKSTEYQDTPGWRRVSREEAKRRADIIP